MDAYVIVVTKDRPDQVCELLDWLAEQSLQPALIMVVGTQAADVAGVRDHPLAMQGLVEVRLSRPGACAQRNVGLDAVLATRAARARRGSYFAVFFDDDFRPDRHWLAACRAAFLESFDVVGITGRVLADGAHQRAAVSTAAARDYLRGRRRPARHWASGAAPRQVECLYGCNMAYRDALVASLRFDENLALYGWQEDQDMSTRASRFGRILYVPSCAGVHLGVKSGRVSGLRFGYSQIANPLYLSRKGTMTVRKALRLVLRNVAANTVRSVHTSFQVDYPGRLNGNLLALSDVLRGRSHPARIVDLA